MEPQAFEVFLSYCQQDESLRKELETHLALLKRQGVVKLWHDRLLVAGQAWEPEISGHLESADVILLLVTPDFLASDYCFDIELRRAMERHEEGSAVVIPVFGRPCDWKEAPFGRVQGLPKNGNPVSRWDDRDEAWLEVTRGLRSACDTLAQQRARGSDTSTDKPWNVPFERNPFFTGREDTLEELHQALSKRHRAVLGQAISGLGGIGKTQTAVEYAYRHREDYAAVFWVRAETEHEIFSGLVEIARRLGLPQASAQDPREAVEATQRWLAEHDDWLVIFDNADRPEILKPFLPKETRGRVLLTSRASRFGGLGIKRPFEIANLPAEQATTFLLERVCREIGSDEQAAAAELAEELGYLPLALEQAGAYLETLQARFDKYLQSYRQRKLELLERQAPQTGDYPESVATTWALNFQEVEVESAAAADLLRACAFLAPDAIPLELFEEGASKLGPALAGALENTVENPLALSEALEPLSRFSLVRRDVAERTVSVHRLVQAVLRSRLKTEERRTWAQRLVEALARVFPKKPEFETWERCERLYPHADTCAELIQTLDLNSPEAANFLNSSGWYASDQARFSEAERFLKQGLAIREHLFGPEHPEVAHSLNDLAVCFQAQGKYGEEEAYQRRSLAIREKVLDPNDPELATSLDNMAIVHDQQGRNHEAEKLFRRSLEIRRRVLGEEHPDFALGLCNLGINQGRRGRFVEAESLLRHALSIHDQQLASNHPNRAKAFEQLASILFEQERYSEAEALYRQSLEILEEALGAGHPSLVVSLNGLGAVCSRLGRLQEAEELILRSMKIHEEGFGTLRPGYAASLGVITYVYERQGELQKARSCLRQSYEIARKIFGPEHPEVAKSLQNLATFHGNHGRLDQAKPLLQRAVTILKRTLGPKHPSTIIAKQNLQGVLRAPRRPGRR